MKVAQVSLWDINGGAARAAYRIHQALRRHGVDSHMYESSATSGDWTVQTTGGRRINWISKFRQPLGGLLTKLLRTENRTLHSPAILPSRWPQWLNQSDADVLHLHWVAAEMMSVADIGLLSIDLDGNDYWVWEAIQTIRPIICICEYNAVFGDVYPICIPYDSNFNRTNAHHSNLYYCASIAALRSLAVHKGYRFVGTNSIGNNAFFVREDYAKQFVSSSLLHIVDGDTWVVDGFCSGSCPKRKPHNYMVTQN